VKSRAYNIRIVLVGTTHPGNIGASARAIKTMGLDELWLVAPAVFPHPQATALASGADDVLERARVVATLPEAIADCTLVVGASARRRGIAWPELTPRACAEVLHAEAERSPVALLFGFEQSGLSNAELDLCNYLVRSPANPEYSSLNLAAAVQVLSYELRLASGSTREGRDAPTPPQPPATADEMARFYAHLERVLKDLGFLNPDDPRHLMRRLRRLFNRARPDQNEMNILRGILSAVEGNKLKK
jgi:TrmH family RNA methyltransferase